MIEIVLNDKIDPKINQAILAIANSAETAYGHIANLQKGLDALGLTSVRLSSAILKNSLDMDKLTRSQNATSISAERLKQEQIKTQIAVINLSKAQTNASIASVNLSTAQNKNAISAKNLQIATTNVAIAQIRLQTAQNQLTNSTNASSNAIVGYYNRLLTYIGAYVSVREIIQLGDAYLNLQNKLRVVTDSETQLAKVSEELFNIAKRTRSPIEETASVYARFDLALKPLGYSQREVLRMTETVNKALTISGANTSEQAAGLLQLSQAFNKGKLDGDEFRSVMELMPTVADAIAKQLKVTRGELLLLAPEGKITADVMAKALTAASTEIDQKFAKTIPTVSQGLTVLRNDAVAAFGDFQKGSNIFSSLALTLVDMGKALENNKLKIWELGQTTTATVNALNDLLSVVFNLSGSSNKTGDSLNALQHIVRGLGLIFSVFADTLRVAAGSMALLQGAITKNDDWTNWGKNLLKQKSSVDQFLDSVEATQTAVKKLQTPTMLPSHGSDALRPAGPAQAKPVDRNAQKDAESRAAALKKINAELEKELNSFGMLSPEKETYNRLTEIEIQLANKKFSNGKRGTQLSIDERTELEKKIATIERNKKVQSEMEQIINSTFGPFDKYIETLDAASILLNRGTIDQSQYNRVIIAAGEAYSKAAQPFYELNKQLKEESDLMAFVGIQQQVESRLQQIKNDLLQKGIVLNEEQNKIYRERIANQIQLNAINQEENKIYDETIGKTDAFYNKVIALQKAMENGLSGGQLASVQMSFFGNLFQGTEIELNSQLNAYNNFLNQIDTLTAKGLMSERDKKIAFAKENSRFTLEKYKKEIDFADQFFGNLATLQNSGDRTLFEIGKAAAIAQATVSGVVAYMKALAMGPPMGPILAASTMVATAAAIGQIMNTKMAGYAKGGLITGGEQVIRVNERGTEFVMNAEATAANRPILEAMNRGETVSNNSSGPKIVIQNFGTSKEFEVQQNTDEIRIIAKDEARKAVREHVPGLVASEIGNPNSPVSKSISSNTTAARRR